MEDLSFPKKFRLTRTGDYRRLYRTGRRVPSASFLLFWGPSTLGFPRIGFSSGRKVGGAVARNRVKRRMREVIRRHRPRLAAADIVLVAHPRAVTLTYGDMEQEITAMLRRARLLP